MQGVVERVKPMLVVLLAVALTALVAPIRPAAAAPPTVSPVTGAEAWARTHTGPQQYPKIHSSTIELTMRDGTILYGDVYRPADKDGRPIETKLPVVVNMTPYTKLMWAIAEAALTFPVLVPLAVSLFNAINLRGIGLGGYNDIAEAMKSGILESTSIDPQLVKSGYVQVTVDVRGTGTSQGTWEIFGQNERNDTVDVIDWASRQPYSNGEVAMSGTSYSGINQLAAGAMRPKALKALFPVVPGGDLINDVVVTGGGMGGFAAPWLVLVNVLKMIPNLPLMLRGRFDFTWLADRISDPISWIPMIFKGLLTPSLEAVDPETRKMLETNSERRRTFETDITKITVPTFAVGGWNDIFANTEWRLLQKIPVPDSQKKLIMASGYHLTSTSAFGSPGSPPRVDVLQRAWFDKWLKGIDNGIDKYRPATLQSQVGDSWTTASTYPVPGQKYQKTYLNSVPSGSHNTPSLYDGSLSSTPPTRSATAAVAPGLSTICSRDAGIFSIGILATFDACGRDSRVSELGALSFTTPKFTRTTTVSGPITVHLNQRLDATDGYWSATVNAVAPDGTSTVISTGQLAVSLRAVDEARSTRAENGALADTRLTVAIKDYAKVVPGRTVAVDIPLGATQAELPPGYRIRLDLYAFNFPKGVPVGPVMFDSQFRPQTVVIDPRQPSWVNIPLSTKN